MVGRGLYITRGATQAREATATAPAVPAFEKRLTIFDLDTLEPVGVIPGVGGNGATVCPNTGHGFTSDHPQPSMFDVKTMKSIKTIEVPEQFRADGIYCDTSNDRVYIGSHPTKSLIVVDAKDGTVLGNVDLGGTPEQTVGDGAGTIYQVLQERPLDRRADGRVRQQDRPPLRDGVGGRATAAASSGGDTAAGRRPRRWPRRRDSGLLHDHHGRQIGLASQRDGTLVAPGERVSR